MQWLFVAIILIGLLLLALNAFMGANPAVLANALRRGAGYAALAIALFLAVLGRIGIALPLAFLGFMLLRGRMPFGGGFPGMGRRSPGQASRVRTPTLEMTLDHDTGAIDGRVLAGRFAGRNLGDLGLAELLALWQECKGGDPKAVPLIEAFLDRHHQDWRPGAGADGEGHGRGSGGAAAGGPMSREEAYEILGLQPGASRETIRRAHRQLMKKLHPDQGGSNYLAAKINEAKDLLLSR